MKNILKFVACMMFISHTALQSSITGTYQDDTKREYDEKRIVDLDALVQRKLSQSRISQNNRGSLENLPLDITLQIIKFVGTRWSEKAHLTTKNGIGDFSVSPAIALCGNNQIAITRGDNLKIFSLKKLAFMKTLMTGSIYKKCVPAFLAKNRLVTGNEDGNIMLWDIDSGKCLRIVSTGEPIVTIAVLSHERVATNSQESGIKIWNINTGECIRTLRHYGDTEEATLLTLSDHRLAAHYTDFNRTIKIWDTISGKCLQTSIKEDPCYFPSSHLPLAFCKPNQLAFINYDKTINIWDTISTKINASKLKKTSGFPTSLLFLSNKQLAVGDLFGRINIWDICSDIHLQELRPDKISSISSLAKRDNLLVASSSDAVTLYEKTMDCDYAQTS